MHRGHVHKETSRKSDVTGDARALLAEWLFGNLDDDVLAGLQHLRDELRPARSGRIAPIMPRTAWTTALESGTPAITTTAVRPSSAVAAAAAERPLEARVWAAANTR